MAEYLTTDTDLQSVADAIRAKGKTSAQLVWPAGYNAAINAINPLTLSANTSRPSSIVTVNDATDLDAKQVVVGIKPVQAGSGDPSPTNVRPISGWTGAKVTRTGKNLLNISAGNARPLRGVTLEFDGSGGLLFEGTPSETGYLGSWALTEPVALPPGTYSISTGQATTLPVKLRFFMDWTTVAVINAGEASATFTLGSEKSINRICLDLSDSSIVGTQLSVSFTDIQLELGSTATAYEPYTGETYSVTFPTEAGTVYGGTLDVTNGVLTVDRAMADLGTLNYSYNAGYQMFVAQVSGMSTSPSKGGLCSILKQTNAWVTSDEWTHGDGLLSLGGSDDYIRCKLTNYTSAADFKATLSGQKFVYELATPVTCNLTPLDIELLSGYNVIFADCGDVALSYYTEDFDDLADEIGFAEGGDY